MRNSASILFLLVIVACSGAPTPEPSSPPAPEANVNRPSLSEALARHAETWMAHPRVHGVYEGLDDEDRPCLKVMVEGIDDEMRRALPREIDGWPVVLVESGPIEPVDAGGSQ